MNSYKIINKQKKLRNPTKKNLKKSNKKPFFAKRVFVNKNNYEAELRKTMTLMSQKRKPSETYNQHKQKHEEKWHVTQENH